MWPLNQLFKHLNQKIWENFGLLLLVFWNSTVIFPFAKRTFSNTYLFGFVKLIYVLLFRVLDMYLFFKGNSNKIANWKTLRSFLNPLFNLQLVFAFFLETILRNTVGIFWQKQKHEKLSVNFKDYLNSW